MKKLLGLLLVYVLFASNVMARDIRFVQITDVRYSKQNNSEMLQNVIKDVNRQKNVDFVVFTGDSLEKPDLQILKDFVSEAKHLRRPFYVVIGDKDVNKYKGLSKKEFQAYLKKKLPNYKTADLNYTFEKSGMVFMVADGAKDVIPSTNGYFKDDVVEWVDANLDLNYNKNVIILQHFPLTEPEENESYRTFKPQNYLDVIKKHNNVKAVISGHFGINKEVTEDGVVHISTAPLPYYRIIDVLDCTSKQPVLWAEVRQVK